MPIEDEPSAVAYWSVAALLGLLSLAAIWLPEFPVGTDLPTHMLFATALGDPERFGELIQTSAVPTGQLWVWLVSPLSMLGPSLAAKLGLTLGALVTLGGFEAIGRALGRRRGPALLFGVVATHTFYTAMGFLNFTLACALALGAIALAIRAWAQPSLRRYGGLGLCMLAVALGHVIVAGMAALHIGLLCLVWGSGLDRRRLGATLAALAPASAFAGLVAMAARTSYHDTLAARSLTHRVDLIHQVSAWGQESLGGLSELGWPVLAVGAVALVFGARSECGARHAKAITLAGGVWLALFAIVPFHGLGWAYAQVRLLFPLLLVPLAFTSWGPRPTLMLAAIACTGGSYLATTAHTASREGAQVAAAVAGFGSVAPGNAMEVVLDPGEGAHPAVQPLLHAGQYALAAGGASALLPRYSPLIHSVRATREEWPEHPPLFVHRALQCDSPQRCAHARQLLLERIASQGRHYDSVVLVGGDPWWREALSDRGYEALAPAIVTLRPSTLIVQLTLPPEAAYQDLILRVGYPDTIGWFEGRVRPAATVDEGTETIEVHPLPAGVTAIEVLLAPSGGQDDEGGATRAQVELIPGETTRVQLGVAQ